MSEKKYLHIDSYVADFGEELAARTLSLIKASLPQKDDEIKKLAQQKFLKSYVETIILESLGKHVANVELSQKELEKKTEDELLDIKLQIQGSIEAAFESAMSSFTGYSIDYYCQIKPVPEPINKEPC